MSAFGSFSAATGRFDIQGRCQLSDGSIKPIGILGFESKEPFAIRVWKELLKKMNDESGQDTKGEMLWSRDELIAAGKHALIAD